MNTAHSTDPIEAADPDITVSHGYLRRQQQLHAAIVTTLLPLAGVIAAIALAWAWGWDGRVLWILAVSYTLTVIGLEVGYHRHFTHLSFKTVPWVRDVLAILGSMCGQGPVIYWVSTHRRHHQYSDRPGDPHSPRVGHAGFSWRGFWHAYLGWTYTHDTPNTARFAKDWLRNPAICRINRQYLLWLAAGVLLPALWGLCWLGGWKGLALGAVWGGLLRIFLVTNAALGVTSLCHIVGSRPYRTSDDSRNVVWLVLPTFGQAWHNHHHAFPNSAVMGFKWWQIDLGTWVIVALGWCGLASDIARPSEQQLLQRRQ